MNRLPASETLVLVGTYTSGESGSKGIYRMWLNPETGALSTPEVAAETTDPSFLALHPTKRVVYAVNETDTFGGQTGDKATGGVTAFTIGEAGELKKLNDQPSLGKHPCYIAIDRSGALALVANYSGGNVAALPLDADGRLQPGRAQQHTGSSVNKDRQKGPHAHSIDPDPSNRYALSADLGIDKVLVYKLDSKTQTIAPNDPPSASIAPGSGPRHIAFDPKGRTAYVINELTSTVTVLAWDAEKGTLRDVQTISALPDGYDRRSYSGEIEVHPSGRLVFVSNRGHNSLAIFKVDQESGRLTLAGHQSTGGDWPRNFATDPSGRFLLAANQRSVSIVVFRVDVDRATLTPTGVSAGVPAPASIRFIAAKS